MLTYIIYAIVFVVLATAAYAGISAAPWLPTKPKQKRHLMDQLELSNGTTVYDLGCGTGTLLFSVVEKNPQVNAIGLEISVLPFVIAKIKSWLKSSKNVSIRYANLFQKEIFDADIVFVFLLSKSYRKLWEKFARELKDDALVILEAWPFPDLKPIKTIKEDGLLPVYFYLGRQFRE